MRLVLQCTNKECSCFGKQFEPGKYTLKYDEKLGKMNPVSNSVKICPVCGKQLFFIEMPGEDTIPKFSNLTFKGKSDEEKKKILRQRFDTDIKKNSGDEKEYRKKEAFKKFLGADKD